ncbi:MAG: MBL fold metallo-hydrolase [Candidatus Bathyarchaeota archaeon]|nr:MAG: MBL fold metallo-hydrolase [Candidatus Bathyarchaeota archaeon]
MRIHFLGGVREVGGSCIAVGTDYGKVALDYGIKVGEEVSDRFPKDFDAVIISHAHLDHSGNLLSLSRGNPVIIGSRMTRDVTTDLLRDMIKIQNMNGNHFTYDNQDADNIRKSWWIRDSVALLGMSIQLYPAGHVAGAKMTSIHVEGKEILYTGDFCLHDTEILEGSKPEKLPQKPDALIIESTYGGKVRPPRNDLVDQLFRQILRTIERKGNVLIPAFAFHRSQEMAKRIDQAMEDGILPNYNVYTISPLAQKITGYFNNYKQFFTQEIQQEKQPFNYRHVKQLYRIGQIQEPAIVICTSGFGHAGASLRLLTEWATDEDNSVVVNSGYLPPESPLKIAKEKRELMKNGNKINVQAEVKQIELSSHADQGELIQLVEALEPKRTFLVHGEVEQAQLLSEKISGTTEVYVPERHETISM